MMFICKETDYTVNDRPFCNYDDKETTYLIYKCVNCNYKEKRIEYITGGSQYVPKTEFWWK